MQLAGNLWPDTSTGASGRDSRGSPARSEKPGWRSEIERNYSKDKILELYLNQIDLGNRAFGVEAAAQRYFGKSVRSLNVAEAAMLAGLPQGTGHLQSEKESPAGGATPESWSSG